METRAPPFRKIDGGEALPVKPINSVVYNLPTTIFLWLSRLYILLVPYVVQAHMQQARGQSCDRRTSIFGDLCRRGFTHLRRVVNLEAEKCAHQDRPAHTPSKDLGQCLAYLSSLGPRLKLLAEQQENWRNVIALNLYIPSSSE